MVLNPACPPEASLRSVDCPIGRDLFHPMGPASGCPNDPNGALWDSIRPGPPPSWPARLREHVTTSWHEAYAQHVRRRWLARLASYPSAQDGLSSAVFGLVLGLCTGLAMRPFIIDLAARSQATVHQDPIARAAPPAGSPVVR
jgi:hypothetical protein